MAAASPIIRFYVNGESDPLGRTYASMMYFTEERMEDCHDWVQWMFPTAEPSVFASVYPVLTEDDVAALQASPVARAHLLAAVEKFKDFMGIGAVPDETKWLNWCTPGNHNLLRVTRIIRALRLFGEEVAATSFKHEAQVVAVAREVFTAEKYWHLALTVDPMKSLREYSAE